MSKYRLGQKEAQTTRAMQARDWIVLIAIVLLVSAGIALIALFSRTPAQDATPSVPVSTETKQSTPTTPPASPTPTPFVYTVQGGDTLGEIARAHGVSTEDLIAANDIDDPNVLHIGQPLVIPVGGPSDSTAASSAEPPVALSETASLPPASLPTLTPSGSPLVEISQLLGSGELATEVVIVRNRGGMVNLEHWTLSNVDGDTFTFPALTLFQDTQVLVHSASGTNTPDDLYWGRIQAAWSGGELITLRDAAGNIVDTYVVP